MIPSIAAVSAFGLVYVGVLALYALSVADFYRRRASQQPLVNRSETFGGDDDE